MATRTLTHTAIPFLIFLSFFFCTQSEVITLTSDTFNDKVRPQFQIFHSPCFFLLGFHIYDHNNLLWKLYDLISQLLFCVCLDQGEGHCVVCEILRPLVQALVINSFIYCNSLHSMLLNLPAVVVVVF